MAWERSKKVSRFVASVLVGLVCLAVAVMLGTYLFMPGIWVRSSTPIVALQSEGWTDVQIVSSHYISPYWWGGCGKDDDVGFDMKGKNPAHTDGTATVCCALYFKGCTIRH